MARDLVLLVTHTGDFFTIDRVEAAVRRRGCEAVRLDVDRFPTGLTLTTRDGRPSAAWDGVALDVSRVRAVWNRRLWSPALPEDLDPLHRQACLQEIADARDAWLACLETAARQVNDPRADLLAENKARQLAAARAEGLTLPPTLITNDPAAVRAFWAEHEGDVVAKMLTAVTVSMDGAGAHVCTSRVGEADLDDLDGLALCPMVFQRFVPKEAELRVVLVDGELHVGEIDARGTEKGSVDWRGAAPGEAPWRRGALPGDVADRLRGVARRLGLVYGAADVIRRPDGEHVFLEINPGGEWGMLERDLDLPIADSIARALTGEPA
jgi:glutathione synthase/RimK-type ligase-like ATP-grasp enzyme